MWLKALFSGSQAKRFSRIVAAVALATCISAVAQTTISQGSIQGTITDPSGAVGTGHYYQ